MTIPSLPTDSLYKFLFIGGIVLMISSIYFHNELMISLPNNYIKIDSLGRQADYNRINSDRAIKDLESIGEEISENEKLIRSGKQVDISSIKPSLIIMKLRNDSLEIEGKRVLVIQKQLLDNQQRKLDNLDSFLMLFIIGFVLTIINIIFWHRQQKVQDKLQATQLAILELEYQSKLNPTKSDLTKYRKP